MEGELFQKVGFIAGIYNSAIFHIAFGNPKFTKYLFLLSLVIIDKGFKKRMRFHQPKSKLSLNTQLYNLLMFLLGSYYRTN